MRLTFDNNYFNALYQGIPVGGYTKMVANLLDGIEVRLNEDYLEKKEQYDAMAEKVPSTRILTISWELWSIVPCVLRMKHWINLISREMQQ